jgi:hypothetical protein
VARRCYELAQMHDAILLGDILAEEVDLLRRMYDNANAWADRNPSGDARPDGPKENRLKARCADLNTCIPAEPPPSHRPAGTTGRRSRGGLGADKPLKFVGSHRHASSLIRHCRLSGRPERRSDRWPKRHRWVRLRRVRRIESPRAPWMGIPGADKHVVEAAAIAGLSHDQVDPPWCSDSRCSRCSRDAS